MNLEGVRQAVYSRLAGFAALNAVTNSIGYDRPQDDDAGSGDPFPFTIISDVSATRWDTKTSDGATQLIQVSTFARATGSKSAVGLANEAAQAAYDALHNFDLVVSGSNVVTCLLDGDSGNLVDPDGLTRHRALTFSIRYDDGS